MRFCHSAGISIICLCTYNIYLKRPLSIEPYERLYTEGSFFKLSLCDLTFEVEDLQDTT